MISSDSCNTLTFPSETIIRIQKRCPLGRDEAERIMRIKPLLTVVKAGPWTHQADPQHVQRAEEYVPRR